MSKHTLIVGDRPFSLETGTWAQQADGSVVLRAGDGLVLVTVVGAAEPRPGADFFPLTVEYRERMSAVGRIPGSYQRRELRAADHEILCSRLVDRSIRPLFPKAFQSETQVIATVFSGDPGIDLATLSITGASLALMLSDIPWEGPIAGVRVGRIDGAFVAFPTPEQAQRSDLDFVVTVGDVGILMVEGEAREVAEDDMVACLRYAQQVAAPLLEAQRDWQRSEGRPKRALPEGPTLPAAALAAIEGAAHSVREALGIHVKRERRDALALARAGAVRAALEALGESEGALAGAVQAAADKLVKRTARALILDGRRMDGRRHDQVRPISAEVRVLPSAHGSALFSRGETQALASATLGAPRDSLRIETLDGQQDLRFFLHYNFPPYSTGETKALRGPGRREIGHGMLAQRALQAVLPTFEAFPYVIRVMSDILSSNGSSSMATVCGGCLALLDAGVPLHAPVAGIAMGLIAEGPRVAVLTDILGDEDHLGDMDFKVCGTRHGITALQMDLKIEGLTDDVLRQALQQARAARIQILDAMHRTLPEARQAPPIHADKVARIKVRQERIGQIIGSGGGTIRGLSESTGANIEIDDHGWVRIAARDADAVERAVRKIEHMVHEPRVGEVIPGIVVKLSQSFARLELSPGTEASMHISEAADGPLGRFEDVMDAGDTVMVKVLGVDDRGTIRVSRRQAAARSTP